MAGLRHLIGFPDLALDFGLDFFHLFLESCKKFLPGQSLGHKIGEYFFGEIGRPGSEGTVPLD